MLSSIVIRFLLQTAMRSPKLRMRKIPPANTPSALTSFCTNKKRHNNQKQKSLVSETDFDYKNTTKSSITRKRIKYSKSIDLWLINPKSLRDPIEPIQDSILNRIHNRCNTQNNSIKGLEKPPWLSHNTYNRINSVQNQTKLQTDP